MAIIKKTQPKRRVIDLTGPDGNAYVLLGIAKSWLTQMGYEPETIELIMMDMKSGDYENLIQKFDEHFGSFCDLER